MHLEEDALLAELVELRVAVEEAGGDKLVEDAHDEGRKDGEKDVVERESPGFEDDLTRKGVLERVLIQGSAIGDGICKRNTYPELGHI